MRFIQTLNLVRDSKLGALKYNKQELNVTGGEC